MIATKKLTRSIRSTGFRLRLLAIVATLVNACQSSTQLSQSTIKSPVKIDGSSTVYPITKAVATEFKVAQATPIEVTVDFSGTSGGFKKFCAGETDVNNASRPINAKEIEQCKQNGVPYIELLIAFDALTIAIHPNNTWAKDITVAELKKLWEPEAEGKITKWNQIRSDWPDRPINLYGAGGESGTFDYFTEAIVGKTKASRKDYKASEDDNELVKGVSSDPNALGYFGFAYYEANLSKLKVLPVDSGKGAITPDRKTVEKAEYQPLSRPLFIYVNAKLAQDKPEVREFIIFYITKASSLVNTVGYIPLPEEGYRFANLHFYNSKVGTVFEGKAQINLTLGELLRKQATY